jgi:hypothetical protein
VDWPPLVLKLATLAASGLARHSAGLGDGTGQNSEKPAAAIRAVGGQEGRRRKGT